MPGDAPVTQTRRRGSIRASLRALTLVQCFAIVALALFSSRSAIADASLPDAPAQKPSAQDLAQAKKLFDTGLKLFNESAYDAALVEFESSYKLAGRPSALRNIAQCHRSLHHFVEAYVAYDALLTRHESELSAGDKKLVAQAKEELGSLTGSITIGTVSAPDGVRVELDGKQIAVQKAVRVALGAHKIVATKDGFLPFTSDLQIAPAEQKRIDVTLTPESQTGHVVVREIHERPVHVLVDGKDVGPAPFEADVGAGDHVIELKGEKFGSERRTIHVVKKERSDVTLDAVALTGVLRVSTNVVGAQISIDGKVVGSGFFQGDFSDGPHTIEVSAPGYTTATKQVAVDRGQTLALDIPLASGGAQTKAPQAPSYRGVYVRLNLEGAFGLSGSPDNSVAGITTSDRDPSLSAGVSLRVGYAFLDFLSAEILASGWLFHQKERLSITAAPPTITNEIDFESTMPGAFFGAGPRVTSKDEFVRFTLGVTPGVALRYFNVNENVQTVSQGSGVGCLGGTDEACGNTGGQSQSGGYATFGLRMDGAILLGSTPGTKFVLGVQTWIDFPPTVVVGPVTPTILPNNGFPTAGRGYWAANGAQFFIGPMLGLQFGR